MSYHTVKALKLSVSVATIYRYISKGYSGVSPIDLPRAVKFKPRRGVLKTVPSSLRKDRTYADFTAYCEENEIGSCLELDTVIGAAGGKVIMTLHFTSSNFMVGILLDNKTAGEAAAKLNKLKETLLANGFSFGDTAHHSYR